VVIRHRLSVSHCPFALPASFSDVEVFQSRFCVASTHHPYMEMTFWLPATEAVLAEVEGKA
jgi:hypothetical protein